MVRLQVERRDVPALAWLQAVEAQRDPARERRVAGDLDLQVLQRRIAGMGQGE